MKQWIALLALAGTSVVLLLVGSVLWLLTQWTIGALWLARLTYR